MLQYKYSPPPRCVAVCAEGSGRYIWVSLSAPKDSLSKGPHLQCVSAVGVAVQRAGGDCAGGGAGLSFLPPLCGTSLLMLCYSVWTPGMWGAASSVTFGSLGFPVSATSHIYDTDIKEAQEIEVRCGLLFLHIYPEERTCYSILKLMFMHHFTLSR